MTKFVEILKGYASEKNIGIFMVGGAVRDGILNKGISDYDFAVDGDFDEAALYFAGKTNGSYVKMHNDVSRVVVEGIIFDFCKLKGRTIYDDLNKRDFTINSIALDIRNDKIIDTQSGMDDIKSKIIKMTYNDAFVDDPIRMLRAFRFYAAFGFDIEKDTLENIKKNAKLIASMPGERITSELLGIFNTESSRETIELMDSSGLITVLFPTMVEMKELGRCKYHVVDAFTHSILALKFLEENVSELYDTKWGVEIRSHLEEKLGCVKRLAVVKVGTFFHDIGKIEAYKNENGRISFKLHDKLGREKFSNIASRFNMSYEQSELIKDIIGGHMRVLGLFKQESGDRALYRFFREYKDNSIDVIICSLYDVTATRSLLDENGEGPNYREYILKLIDKYYTKVTCPGFINGSDVIRYTGASGGKIGEILNKVNEEVFIGSIKNREEAVKFLQGFRR